MGNRVLYQSHSSRRSSPIPARSQDRRTCPGFDQLTQRRPYSFMPTEEISLSCLVVITVVHLYQDMNNPTVIEIERVQTGVRIEKRLLKVLKAVSELKDMT